MVYLHYTIDIIPCIISMIIRVCCTCESELDQHGVWEQAQVINCRYETCGLHTASVLRCSCQSRPAILLRTITHTLLRAATALTLQFGCASTEFTFKLLVAATKVRCHIVLRATTRSFPNTLSLFLGKPSECVIVVNSS